MRVDLLRFQFAADACCGELVCARLAYPLVAQGRQVQVVRRHANGASQADDFIPVSAGAAVVLAQVGM